ncbi:YdcF family protein [Endozoicomonas gorgoniicola]|uniref:YdcF family protein n=1 Tax=Endozoicomonas gorgoniicola TaxID=1234144 RepID=A0ABT3N367_9GAMM|nr:YdcF family protein [Endozoicomonas gorgoniicola]MCW7556069.1 YdcF family protein [Endozoicomonas gorgoniicola]
MRWFLKQSLLPPVLLIWMVAVGLIFKTTLGWLPWLALLVFYGLSTTPVATVLSKGLEWYEALDTKSSCQEADAIVILGGGYPRSTPEYEGFQPTALSLERIRYGATVHRQCGVPLLASGGGERSEAETMAEILRKDYGINVRWQEKQSLTTWQNALYSYDMLSRDLGKENLRIILVTHSWHMPRSVLSYQKMGFEVIPAPTLFTWSEVPWKKLRYWLPQTRNLRSSELALHEYLGLIWYWLSDRLHIDN